MKTSLLRWSAFTLAAGAWTLLSAGCIMSDGGYGYDDGGYAGPGYYDSFGVDYGGWGPGYHVAPFRGGDHHRDGGGRDGGGRDGGGHTGGPSYHPAPASRPTPSLPHGGGGHGGHGGGGGGGHGGGVGGGGGGRH
jgi:hypothetical protein